MIKRSVYSKGSYIGLFDENTIKDDNGKIIYCLIDNDVFAPLSYSDSDLQFLNKGQLAYIGKYIESQCLASDEVIFEIRN